MTSDSEGEQNLSSAIEILDTCKLGKRGVQPGRRPGQDGNPEQSTSPVQKKKTPIKKTFKPEELKEEEEAPKKKKQAPAAKKPPVPTVAQVVSAIVDEVIADDEPMDAELPGRMSAHGDECW